MWALWDGIASGLPPAVIALGTRVDVGRGRRRDRPKRFEARDVRAEPREFVWIFRNRGDRIIGEPLTIRRRNVSARSRQQRAQVIHNRRDRPASIPQRERRGENRVVLFHLPPIHSHRAQRPALKHPLSDRKRQRLQNATFYGTIPVREAKTGQLDRRTAVRGTRNARGVNVAALALPDNRETILSKTARSEQRHRLAIYDRIHRDAAKRRRLPCTRRPRRPPPRAISKRTDRTCASIPD